MKRITTILIMLLGVSSFSQGQTTVVYDIKIDSLVGLELTSGDICTAPFTVEEAKQMSIGNSWGGMWTSINAGTATSVLVELSFTVSNGAAAHPTTLNGTLSNNVTPGTPVNCELGSMLSWNIDPANYNASGVNTFLVDYAGSTTIDQIDNIAAIGDPYIRVTVTYEASGVGINELNGNEAELVKIVDLTGRETEFKPNTPLIYMYSDGSAERVYRVQ